jgi:hypothetical protein
VGERGGRRGERKKEGRRGLLREAGEDVEEKEASRATVMCDYGGNVCLTRISAR